MEHKPAHRPNVVSMFGQPVGSVPPLDIGSMAQATRDHGMQDALDDAALRRIRARLNGKPVHVRPSYFATLAADWRDVVSEVRGSPYSHALVAALTVIAWTALLVIPTLIGVGK